MLVFITDCKRVTPIRNFILQISNIILPENGLETESMNLKLTSFRKIITKKTYFIRDFNTNNDNFHKEIQSLIVPILTSFIRRFNRYKAYFKLRI